MPSAPFPFGAKTAGKHCNHLALEVSSMLEGIHPDDESVQHNPVLHGIMSGSEQAASTTWRKRSISAMATFLPSRVMR